MRAGEGGCEQQKGRLFDSIIIGEETRGLGHFRDAYIGARQSSRIKGSLDRPTHSGRHELQRGNELVKKGGTGQDTGSSE
jgi:hypothetical protein